MDNSAQHNQATQAANGLLERIFPSLRVTAAGPVKAEAVEAVVPVIALYRSSDGDGSDVLVLGGKSLITAENRGSLRAGRYLLMIVDMPSHAEAAAVAMRLAGAVDEVEVGKTATGNGVLLCHLKGEAVVPASRRISFEGVGGDVQIHWHDCRSTKGEVDWTLSLEVSRKVASAWIRNASCHTSCSADCVINCASIRARSVAKSVADGLTCELSASLFQAEFERSMPGARISAASVSVQDVIEALEDMTVSCPHMVDVPSAETIRSAILRHFSEYALSPQQIAKSIAMALVGQNLVRAA